jgi:predicted nucleic acid-binding protein
MTPVFLDASGLIALVNKSDRWHAAAVDLWADLISSRVLLVTTSLVLIELGDGLSQVQLRSLAVATRQRLLRFSLCEVVGTTGELESEGWKLFASRSDKSWGVTDCISMLVARQRGVTRVFSADRHFAQAGFELLLPNPS